MIILLSTGTWGVILGVASIIIAILIYYLQKIIRYPGQLKFALVETWKVMSASPGGYKDLSLRYNDYEIEEDLNYVKFILYNTKSYDFSSGNDDNPIRLTLPAGCKWIDAKIVGCSEEVQADIVNKNGIELDLTFKLLRKNEFIELDGLLESNSNIGVRNMSKNISVRHRIPNVAAVKTATLLDPNEYKQARSRLITFGIMLALIFSVLFYALVLHPTSPLRYKELKSGEIRALYLDKEGKIVYHKGMFIWNGYSDPIKQEEFVKQYEPYFEKSSFEKSDYVHLSMLILSLLLLGLMVVLSAFSLIETKELRKIMKVNNNK